MSNNWRQCIDCCKTFPETPEHFQPYVTSSGSTLLRGNCIRCRRERSRKHMQSKRADPVAKLAVNEAHRKWYRSDKGRSYMRTYKEVRAHKWRGKIAYDWSAADWAACKAWWGNLCAYCGAGGKLSQDHFVPLRDPNTPGTVPENMVPACLPCDHSKNGRSPYEWCKDNARLERIVAYLESRP